VEEPAVKHLYLRILPLALVSGALVAPHALAQTPETPDSLETLDTLSEITDDEANGITFAQAEAARGELLQAIAALERVLAHHPKSQTARLLHAVYHCRIDDRAGGMVELEKLKKKDFPEETWNQAMAVCAAPTPAEGGE
jgi:hypothetical protein